MYPPSVSGARSPNTLWNVAPAKNETWVSAKQLRSASTICSLKSGSDAAVSQDSSTSKTRS